MLQESWETLVSTPGHTLEQNSLHFHPGLCLIESLPLDSMQSRECGVLPDGSQSSLWLNFGARLLEREQGMRGRGRVDAIGYLSVKC